MRYLVYELTSKRADGKDLYAVSPGSPDISGEDCTMNKQNVRGIVRSIGCMALAAVEVGMSQFDKDHGVRRVSINNQDDLISAHHNFKDSPDDERWIIEGNKAHLGHAPTHMMGRRKTKSELTGEDKELSKEFHYRGYALDDPRVARRVKEFFAPHYGKAAVAHVYFDEQAKDGTFILEAAAGTTRRMLMEGKSESGLTFAEKIRRALGVLFRVDPKPVPVPGEPDRFTIHCEGADFTNTKDLRAMEMLNRAFKHLRNPEQKGLVIAQEMIDEDIGKRLEQMRGTSKRC
jgi:hypothetical protein